MRSASAADNDGAWSSIRDLLTLAAHVFRNVSFARRPPLAAVPHDLVGALEAQRLGMARRRGVVLLCVEIHLNRVSYDREHRRVANDITGILGRATRSAARSGEWRLARTLDRAATPQLGHHGVGHATRFGESRFARQQPAIEEQRGIVHVERAARRRLVYASLIRRREGVDREAVSANKVRVAALARGGSKRRDGRKPEDAPADAGSRRRRTHAAEGRVFQNWYTKTPIKRMPTPIPALAGSCSTVVTEIAQHASTNNPVVTGCSGTRTASRGGPSRARNTISDAPVSPKNKTSIATT